MPFVRKLDTVQIISNRLGVSTTTAKQIAALTSGQIMPTTFSVVRNGSNDDASEAIQILTAVGFVLNTNNVQQLEVDGEVVAVYLDRGRRKRMDLTATT